MRAELETEQNCNILTPTLMAITAFLSRSPGLLNRGPGGPASLGYGPHSSIFSPTGLISNWLNFLCPELYNNLTSTLLPASVTISHSIQPVHGQGYILIFLDRMHQLFTQVHFLFWQLGRGQYVTKRQSFWVSVDLGNDSTRPGAPEMKPHHWILFSTMPRTHFCCLIIS